ncbi:putative G-protein coupled receptor 171 [Oryzias melastigma]|uniref:Putative G-protein coupled receptor 171 n=1 Tax=Oryzias melastigma TaxID=30732 RepID=A0A834CBT0_ORYME|nr:putative G-protein coupled receptor 171 [Oryzias melastigma]
MSWMNIRNIFSEILHVEVSCLLVSQDKRSARVYLLNLQVANLLFLAALPFKVLNDLGAAPWSLKVFHCQCSAVTTYISLYASVAFLAFIIVDRYLQDRDMARSLRLQEPSFAWLLCGVVWLLLLLIMVPNMVLPTKTVQVQTYLSCISLKEEFGLRWHTLSVFLNTALFLNASAAVLVSSGLAVKHLLRRRSDPAWRAVVSMAVLALAYVLSFVPYHAVRTPYTLAQTRVITDCRTKRQLFLGKEATLVLSMLHVCLDPLLFFYLDAAFRGVIRGLLPCKLQSRGNAAENTDAAGGADGEESAVDPDALHVCRRSPSLHETEDDPRTS